jgi:phosphatidylinositol alpha-mannosyltransferase
VITDEVNGVLVKPKDDEELAATILRLLRNPALSKELGAAGQDQAAHYSWDNIARRVLSYYERLLYEHEQVAEATAAKSRLAAPAEQG